MAYKILLILTVTLTTVFARSYDGYKVYKVTPKTANGVNKVENLLKNGVGEFWEEYFAVNRNVRVMVAADKQKRFEDAVAIADIDVEVIIEDLQSVIDQQMRPAPTLRDNTDSLFSMNWTQYHNLETINAWLDELAANYPSVVSTVVMGTSVENRPIKGIVINYGQAGSSSRLAMIEGTLHAREWIATAVVTWTIKEFLTSTDPEVRALAENFEWHIFPVLNPDGYAYTFSQDRLWRKNRSKASFTYCPDVENDLSNGVDLNRNFAHQWMGPGATQDPCMQTYAGPAAFSEPESKALSEYILNLKNKGSITYYLAYHSYSQLIVIPYSHLSSVNDVGMPQNYNDMYEIAKAGALAAYERFNTTFKYGIAADVLYPMSGTSFDWVKEYANVSVSYLIELRDLGQHNFLLPPDQIKPSGLEMMDCLLAMDRKTRELNIYTGGSASVALNSAVLVAIGLLFAVLM